eukprot:13902702-Ditylum_brightwellii.AAC.1
MKDASASKERKDGRQPELDEKQETIYYICQKDMERQHNTKSFAAPNSTFIHISRPITPGQ